MFTGNMGTESTPTRVYALYKIVASKKTISKSDLKGLMEPAGIYEDGVSSYFPLILKTAIELKILNDQDGMITTNILKDEIKDIEDFRKYVISLLPQFENGQFWKCTNVIVNMNEKIYEYASISDSQMLNYLSNNIGENVSAPMARGWRFWAQFLGFGNMNDFVFLPNAYCFVKDVIQLMNLEKKKEYLFEDFFNSFSQYGKILLPNQIGEKNLNIAMSNALRQLYENKEIDLKLRGDVNSKWILYPSKDFPIHTISSIIIKGVK